MIPEKTRQKLEFEADRLAFYFQEVALDDALAVFETAWRAYENRTKSRSRTLGLELIPGGQTVFPVED